MTPVHGTILGTATSSVSAVYTDPDGGSGQMAFGVWNYQNQLVWSQWSGPVCSGCRATLGVPALPDNWYSHRSWRRVHVEPPRQTTEWRSKKPLRRLRAV